MIESDSESAACASFHNLALYYHSHGPLWRALWGTYEVDANGHAIPATYVTQGARELFYDSPRARYAAIDYDAAGTHGRCKTGRLPVSCRGDSVYLLRTRRS